MRQISETISQPSYDSSGWRLYTGGLSTVIFDIETTGLSSSRDALILGGAMTAGDPGSLRQYLASTPAEEREVLYCYLSDLRNADVWISYNGDTFDRPFLAQRLFKNGLGQKLPLHQSVDLYRLFRRYSPMAGLLPNLRQTTLESALGVADKRRDTITGKESVALYKEYARTGSWTHEKKILLHNHDDLIMLSRLMCVLDKLDLHHIMFQRGFMTGFEEKRILAEKITLGKNFLRVEGRTRGVSGDYDVFSEAYQWSHHEADKRFLLCIPCIYENGAAFIDTELFDVDAAPLADYPSFVNGYLLFHDGQGPCYREINHTVKIILTEILKKI